MVTMAIIAILVTITLPGLKFLKYQSIKTELDKLQTVCQLLQKKAVCTGQKQYLAFDAPNQGFIYEDHYEKLSPGVYFGYLAHVAGPPANPKGLITSAITFPKQKITFKANGTISAGTIYLVDQSKKLLYALTVPVSQVAFIRKYKYQNNTWIYLK